MGDQLERFIQNRREDFDDDPRYDEIQRWKKVESRIQSEGKWDPSYLWKIAAALFLISTVWLMVDKYMAPISEESNEMSEFIQVEAFYTQLIHQKQAELMSYQDEQLTGEFLAELDRLDSMYSQLKKTYQTSANDEIILDAMINNLQLRMDILSQQLNILNTLKQSENESYETI